MQSDNKLLKENEKWPFYRGDTSSKAIKIQKSLFSQSSGTTAVPLRSWSRCTRSYFHASATFTPCQFGLARRWRRSSHVSCLETFRGKAQWKIRADCKPHDSGTMRQTRWNSTTRPPPGVRQLSRQELETGQEVCNFPSSPVVREPIILRVQRLESVTSNRLACRPPVTSIASSAGGSCEDDGESLNLCFDGGEVTWEGFLWSAPRRHVTELLPSSLRRTCAEEQLHNVSIFF